MTNSRLQVHLDLVGGLAGDMFIAAILHAAPDLEGRMRRDLACLPALSGLGMAFVPHNDGIIEGRRFEVVEAHGRGHHGHAHHAWRDIRMLLHGSALPEEVKHHATAIFACLAAAEGRVHGVAAEAVTFHEVGALDSIADIVGTASLIASLDADRWTWSAVPIGSGRVRTQHGSLPVPAPAVAVLLEGFQTFQDGVDGERITPTGAAILRHLADLSPAVEEMPDERRLIASGFGFGQRSLPGLSNCVRVLLFDGPAKRPAEDRVTVIEFEVDDQTGEDLAMGLAAIRAAPGVLDVHQYPTFGKKNRMAASVRVLTLPPARDHVIAACFSQTTTIGLRHTDQCRTVLRRQMSNAVVEGRELIVKLVERPEGTTAKLEADMVSDQPTRSGRDRLRRLAETSATAGNDDGH